MTIRFVLLLLAVGLLLFAGCMDDERNVEHQDLIAFIREPWNTYFAGLFVSRPDGSSERRLSDPDDIVHGVAWTADGSRLSYLGWETLFELNPDGSDRRALLDVSKYYSLQGWSPDSRYLALGIGWENMHSCAAPVSLLPEDSSVLKHLDILGPTAWSPNGRRLAYTERGIWCYGLPTKEEGKAEGLYTVDVESQQRTRLTHSGTSVDLSPAWFPNGWHLAFLRSDRYENKNRGDLYVLALDGGRLVRHATGVEEFAIAPEGSRLAWATGGALFTRSLDAPDAVRLSNQRTSSLTWSPDGKSLAYVADSTSGRADIYTVSIEDRRVRQVTNTAAAELEVHWRPD